MQIRSRFKNQSFSDLEGFGTKVFLGYSSFWGGLPTGSSCGMAKLLAKPAPIIRIYGYGITSHKSAW
jgi:hypothetical protein